MFHQVPLASYQALFRLSATATLPCSNGLNRQHDIICGNNTHITELELFHAVKFLAMPRILDNQITAIEFSVNAFFLKITLLFS